jgi:hypothetical protein
MYHDVLVPGRDATCKEQQMQPDASEVQRSSS